MTTTIIICATVILCLVLVLKWITDMSRAELPMFTYGECVQKDTSEDQVVNSPIGFAPPEEEEKPKDKTDKEAKDAVLRDPVTMLASLLRGEVDIDDITN